MTSSARATPYPDFFIVGAPKCGTTAMYEYLRQHPQIFMPFHKEPLYFGEDLTHRYGRMTDEEYRSLFAGARPGQRVGEASAWYLYSRTAAREIKAASPDASIIVMLRNPIDVMHAQHSQLLFSRQEDVEDFEEALRLEEDRVDGRRLPAGSFRPENLLYRRMVRFAEQLERYFDAFGRDRVHVIVHEDLRGDLADTYRSVLRFLGVDTGFAPDFRAANVNKRARSRLVQSLIWNPPLIRRLVPRLRRYPIVHGLRARLLALNSREVGRDPVDPALRERLEAELAPEVARLGRLLERDLSAWVGGVGATDPQQPVPAVPAAR
jgi:Sulfotransferase domain